ncbi:hypothetical protein HU200_059615 [Digitaria exilis]|uniref:DUF6598 domain-containing protein n=1 Tax=Digitaria exilis TaxID=1010633 RepID=A0A835ACF2_9POAL|nr:hypothetical protein HU200_059615 [Digitaria exilis]
MCWAKFKHGLSYGTNSPSERLGSRNSRQAAQGATTQRALRQMEATKLGGNDDHGHKRSDLDQVSHGGDVKRPRDGKVVILGMEMGDGGEDDAEEEPGPYHNFHVYYKNWLSTYGSYGLSFDAETEYGPMRYTNGPILPMSAGPCDTMEVFFVKVAQISGGLQWPLDVYGAVAVRDSLDRKSNYLFRRDRNKCQTLTSPQACANLCFCPFQPHFQITCVSLLVSYNQSSFSCSCNGNSRMDDSLLELTGPSRAILLRDEPVFEIELKVKGEGNSSSEDDVLCLDVFGYNNISYKGKVSYAMTEVLSSIHSRMQVRFAHVKRSIEATIVARITEGSGNFSLCLTAYSTSIREDVVLLDSRGQNVPVNEDGKVELQRRVVGVEEQGKLILRVKVVQLGDTSDSCHCIEKELKLPARSINTDSFS